MERTVIGHLKPGTLAAYAAVAEAHGRSLEAELRSVIEDHAPRRPKDCAALLRLSDEALAMTPDGPTSASDSTLLIRWDRDTDHGRDVDDGRTDAAGC